MAETGGMGGPGAFLAAEIASQPDCWRRAAGLAGDLRALLPAGRIALAGCGTSAYVAQAAAVHWETAGLGEADAFAASEMPAGRSYDTVVVVSRSGTTTEAADLLHRLGEARTVAVVGDAAGPVARAATHHLELGFADERSVVQTRFATSVVALFRALAGDDVGPVAAAAAAALGRPAPVPAGADRFVFLGTGAAVGLAHEAALKLREAALTVTESYRRWSTATGRSRPPGRASSCGCSAHRRPASRTTSAAPAPRSSTTTSTRSRTSYGCRRSPWPGPVPPAST